MIFSSSGGGSPNLDDLDLNPLLVQTDPGNHNGSQITN